MCFDPGGRRWRKGFGWNGSARGGVSSPGKITSQLLTWDDLARPKASDTRADPDVLCVFINVSLLVHGAPAKNARGIHAPSPE